jgi:hypothetical protein
MWFGYATIMIDVPQIRAEKPNDVQQMAPNEKNGDEI